MDNVTYKMDNVSINIYGVEACELYCEHYLSEEYNQIIKVLANR